MPGDAHEIYRRSASGRFRPTKRSVVLVGSLLMLAAAVAAAALPGEAVAQSGPPPQGGPPGGMPPGGPMPGNMPRPPKPLELDDLLDLVAKQHRLADRDRDGFLTLVEVRSQIDAMSQAAISDRFRTIDSDRSGAIDKGEFLAWQTAMGARVLSDVAAASINDGLVPAIIPLETGSGMKGQMLRMLVEPLGATTIVQSDQNYDGFVDVGELQKYQRRKFDEFDANSDEFLTMDELPRPGDDRVLGGPPMPRPDGAPPPPRQ